jgi:protein-S-isoprenylcysteine O-methyltransferase Ste14
MFNWKLFFIVSVLNAIFLGWSYKKFKYLHAVYRFFAFESIFALILLVSGKWFYKPFAFHQFFSWLFLLVSLIFVIIGIMHLIRKGEPDGHFENTTKLVSHGIYEYIRHPMYTSLIFLGIGSFIKDMNWYTCLILMAYLIFLVLTAKSEEKELIAKFGHEYELYMTQTKMFIPFVF